MPKRRVARRRSSGGFAGCVTAVFFITAAVLLLWGPARRGMNRYLYPIRYSAEVEASAAEFELPIELVYAVIHTESRFEPNALSRAGAKGLMQLTDSTNEWVAMMLRESAQPERIYEPEFNIRRGCYLLSFLLREFGETEVALAAYNAGIGRVSGWLENKSYSRDGRTLDHIPITETREYVKRVAEAAEYYKSTER